MNHALYLWLLNTGAPLQLYYTIVVTCYGAYLILVSLRVSPMVNIAQSFLILHFSINCMLPLVILGFPRLILFCFLVSCCYQLFSVNVSVSSESLCNPHFNSLNLVYFSVNSSVIFTQLIFGLRSLKSGWRALRVLKTIVLISSVKLG